MTRSFTRGASGRFIAVSPDPYDAMQDARSESRYTDDPRQEPDTREVSERAMMPTQGAVSPAERLYGHG